MISIHNLNKTYLLGKRTYTALSDITLDISAGEIFGVIGRSGAGKSTLMHCLSMLEQPDSGEIIVNGNTLTTLSGSALRAARRNMGMIFQQFNLLSSRTVYDNIALPLTLQRTSATQIQQTIQPLLELTGLADKQNLYPSQLSGGQKQRVSIARALATKPKVLLSDEATSALDPETTFSILNLLRDINQELGITIFMITHEMEVVKQICDRVALLHQGKIIETAAPYDFFASPQTAIGKTFIAAALQYELPPVLKNMLQQDIEHGSLIIRLIFKGSGTKEPMISNALQQFAVKMNILQANIEFIHQHPMGMMLIELQGEHSARDACLQHLRDLGVSIEVLGKIHDDVLVN
jgi:D-methionine transport system ATP-binding protein